jgi:predicted DNA binding CopG/RHH family protein
MDKQLTPEEQDILDSYENEEWESVMSDSLRTKYENMARTTRLQRHLQAIELNIPQADLALLQEQALRQGIPYQTLMVQVLQKYVYGDLVEKPQAI